MQAVSKSNTMATLCCPITSPLEREARTAIDQLKSSPIYISWHRQITSTTDNTNITQPCSPFPRQWSVNYSGKSIDTISTDGKEQIEQSKTRYQYKPQHNDEDIGIATQQKINNSTKGYVTFPATLSLIDQFDTGKLALMIRTGPIAKNETSHIQFCTPDQCIDSVLPCNSLGGIIKESQTNESEYQIMERILPISSIEHVSQSNGIDSWDVLRQSTGVNDLGCACDIKIHGFSDRLLRFDLVDDVQQQHNQSNSGQQQTAIKRAASLRYSFAPVDFTKSISVASSTKRENPNDELDTNNNVGHANSNSNNDSGYTKESIVNALNTIVNWDRQNHKSSTWMDRLTSFLEEFLSLGVSKIEETDDINSAAVT